MKMLNVRELLRQTLFRLTQQHVLRPPAPANQQSLAVHFKDAVLLCVELRGNLAYSEACAHSIRDLSVGYKLQIDTVELWCSHLIGPPQLRPVDVHLREPVSRKADRFRLSCSEVHRLFDMHLAKR